MARDGEATTMPPTALTDAELRALAYFAVGIGSEGGESGRNVSYKLSFAGSIRNGVMHPVGNSGYSIGTLQTDLGQHPEVATSLVVAYQTWARITHPDWVLTAAQQAQTASELGRNGRTIEAQGGRSLDVTIKSHIDTFLASDAGITYVHDRDVTQVNLLMRPGSAVNQLRETTLYQESTLDDQARLAAIVLKLENQAGNGYYPRLINGIRNGTINSVKDAQTTVNGFLPNRAGRDRNGPDYVETGIAHALEATKVFNGLRGIDSRSPLHRPWQDLVNPAQTDQDASRPNLSSEYVAIKGLFLQKAKAPMLIDALDQGGAYGYNITDRQGRSRPQSTSLYASGDDFVVMDAAGVGKAYVGGAWSDVTRSNLTRVSNQDETVDLNINRDGSVERLLHVDPNAPALRPPQREVEPAPPLAPRAATQSATGQHDLGNRAQNVATPGHALKLPMDLRDQAHPGYTAFQRTLGEVHRMEDARGIPHGPHSEQVAAALLVAAERSRQGITNVQMGKDGQVHGFECHSPFESARRVEVSTQQALSGTMEKYAMQWAQARSPHYVSNAPMAQRTAEQEHVLAQLPPGDRQMFDRIRGATPAHISDDVVASALYAAKKNGVDGPDKIASVGMIGNCLWVSGTIPGFRGDVDVSQPSPSLRETAQQTLAFNQQQAFAQQHEEAQRQQRTQDASMRMA